MATKKSEQSNSKKFENANARTPSHRHDGALPRPQRKRKRNKDDRGLPPDKELVRLAQHYLAEQHRHWPELVAQGLLPEATPAVLAEMVQDFKARHRGEAVPKDAVGAFLRTVKLLAGLYGRYSCENSDPLSILDQMTNCLCKAREEGRFVPWNYVYADYSTSGLSASRLGYSSYKALLKECDSVDTTYVDDFTRASRDELEWWKLAHLCRRLNRRMIGASDGFDLSTPDWDIKITLFALLSRLFLRSLREKVHRGMNGAARRGSTLGKLPLGFTRKPVQDESGNVVRRPNGRPLHERTHDEATMQDVIRAFVQFIDDSWSYTRIAKDFNARSVEGWDGWDAGNIRKMLINPAYIGVFIWNKYRNVFDEELQKRVKIKNPPSKWSVDYKPKLALITKEQWRAACRRAAKIRSEDPRTGKKLSRNEKSATTLFSGTLFCECGRELTLARSAGKFKQFHCVCGVRKQHGCKLRNSKSVAIIEKCLLGYLRSSILTEEFVQQVVREANEHLKRDEARPRTDLKPLRAKVKATKKEVNRLFERLTNLVDSATMRAYEQRIAKRQREYEELQNKLRAAEAESKKTPPPLKLARVNDYLEDMRELLDGDIPAAAEAIRILTGRITISLGENPNGRQGIPWIAKFSPNVVSFLAEIAQKKDYPDRVSLGYLRRRNWIKPKVTIVTVEKTPKYEALGPVFLRLSREGSSDSAIAAAYNTTPLCVREVIRFAKTGERPRWNKGKQSQRKSTKTTSQDNRKKSIYKQIAPIVQELWDNKRLTLDEIQDVLRDEHGIGVSTSTIRRAYYFARSDLATLAAEKGESLGKGQPRNTRAGKTRAKILQLLKQGLPVKQVAADVDCSVNTVYRVRQQLRNSSGGCSLKEAGVP